MQIIKKGKSFFQILTVFLFMGFVSSCNKDQKLTGTSSKNNQNSSRTNLAKVNTDSIDCFQFIYPLTVNIPDSAGVLVHNDTELFDLFDEHFDIEDDDECYDDPILVYPVSVTLEDGSVEVVMDNDDLIELVESCFCDHDDDDDDEECFEILFPISILYPDGSTLVLNSIEEADSVYDAWVIVHGDSIIPEIIFPINVELEDGSILIVNDDDEFGDLEDACEGDDDEDCFDFVYPVTILNPDGTQLTVHDIDELEDAFDDWFDNNGSNQEPTFAFPLNVIYEDGTTETVADLDELEEIEEDCED